MSMLTVQANHLREMAYTVERVKNDAVGKLSLSGSIALATAAMDMRDAADTIGQLRNTCQDLQSENEKLKQLVWDMVDYGEGAGTNVMSWFADRMREAGIEVDE